MKTSSFQSARVRLQFVIPPPDLAPYISTYYYTEVPSGEVVEDWMHPEWGNLRVGTGRCYEAGVGTEPLRPVERIIASGPTSYTMRFRIGGGRFWGVGLLPRGWAKFIGQSADGYADSFCDVSGDSRLSHIVPILEELSNTTGQIENDVAKLTAGFRALLDRPIKHERAIERVHEALVTQNDHSVSVFAEAAQMSVRTLERFSRKHFGFSPHLLIRRQRFLRSLAKFMLEPDLSWGGALDGQYFDQSQFVREFKRFMTMTPSEYAALDHPILAAAMVARSQAAGDAMQVLQKPGNGARVGK